MRIFVSLYLGIILVLAGIFAVTQSLIVSAPIAGMLSVMGIFTLIAFKSWNKSFQRVPIIKFQIYIILALAFYLLARALSSPVTEFFKQDLFLIICFFVVYLTSLLLLNNLQSQKMLISFIILIFVVNLTMFIPAVNEWRDDLLGYAKGTKVSGLYNHRNVFANMMMLNTLIFLTLSLFGKGAFCKLFFGLLTIAGLAVIVASKSRGGAVSVGIGSVVIFVIWARLHFNFSSFKMKAISVIIVLFVVISGFIVYEVVDNLRFKNHVGVLERHGGRPEMFAMAVDQIGDAPLLGSGSRSFEHKSYEYWTQSVMGSPGDFVFVHNEFLQMFADYGLIGFILVLILIALSVFMSVKVTDNTKREIMQDTWLTTRSLKVASISVLVGMATHSLFSFPMHSISNVIVFAIISAWLFMQFNSNSGPKFKSNIFYKLPIASYLLIASISGIWVSIPEIKATTVFLKNGIRNDDQNWHPELVNAEQWTEALEEVVTIAPNHERYGKLASLYNLARSEAPEEMGEKLNSKAIKAYHKALEYNPYDSVSMLNIVDYHMAKNKFREAEKWLEKIKKLNVNREKVFKIYYREALLNLRWGEFFAKQNKIDLAIKKSSFAKDAIEKHLKEVGLTNNISGKMVFATTVLRESRMRRKIGDLQAADDFFDQYVEFTANHLNSHHDQRSGAKRILDLFQETNLLKMRNLKRELVLLTECTREILRYKKLYSSIITAKENRSLNVIADQCGERVRELRQALGE